MLRLCLFLSVLGIVLPPDSTGITDSSEDDPKSLSYAHRGNEKNKVIGVVSPQEMTAGDSSRDDPIASRSSPPHENDTESLDIILDHSGLPIERVYNLSPTNLKVAIPVRKLCLDFIIRRNRHT